MEIALLGGSFDPPHAGHLLAAAYVLTQEPVDELWLLPVFDHPFKKPLRASFAHRVRLCELAVAALGSPRLRVSRLEEELGGEGRTVDLLEHLHRTRPSDRFALVLGSDLAAERAQWKRFDRILELCRVIELPRGGYAGPGFALPQVSSSQIRAALAAGQDVSALLPRAVREEIARAGTYR